MVGAPERYAVVLADQRGSRHSPDLVPATLRALDDVGMTLGFERTAGDEIQGLASDAGAVVRSLTVLSHGTGWRLGIGIGRVETPLPDSTRAARGPAYVAAREAIEAAHGNSAGLALRSAHDEDIWTVEGTLVLLRTVLTRRTDEGWEVSELMDDGLSGRAAATRLGISPAAVSYRLAHAAYEESTQGARAAIRLVADLLAGGE